jgi:hypothetical protein
MITPVLTGNAAARAPGIGRDANAIEKPSHIFGGNVEEHLEAAPGRRSFAVGRNGGDNFRGPGGERAIF